jgi:nitrogen fixation protein NifX
MRVAVTTSDFIHVDSAFGLARHVVIYDVTQAGFRRRESFAFPERARGCDDESLGCRAAALKDSLLLYTLELGAGGARAVAREGGTAIPVERPRLIAEVLEGLRRELRGPMRPWLRKSLQACPERARGG